jgi:hypothetical protein
MAKSKSRKSRSPIKSKKLSKQIRFWIPLCWLIGGMMTGANIGQTIINENPEYASTLFMWCRIYLPLIGAVCFGLFGTTVARMILR